MKNDISIVNNKSNIVIEVSTDNIEDELDIDLYTQNYTAVTPKIIKKIESKAIRCSYEYELYVLFGKNVLAMDKSTYFNQYSIQNGYTIELHHSPFTLFDITETVALKHLKLNGFYRDMLVAEEVMKLHFEKKVGLMPVDPTTHELIHSQSLIVHPDIPQGDWKAFIEEYKEYMSEEVREKVREIEYLSTTKMDKYPEILQKKIVTIKNNKIESLYNFELPKLLPTK